MVNNATLIGRLGKDPEYISFDSGSEKVSLSLATSSSYKDKNGEWQEKTQWHNITIWGKRAAHARDYLAKGDLVYISGEITYRDYDDRDGNKRYITEINAISYKKIRTESGQVKDLSSAPLVDQDLPF